jgi:hypothetical protein
MLSNAWSAEDSGPEDLRLLYLPNRELNSSTDCKAIVEFYWKEKESIGTTIETVVGPVQVAEKHRLFVIKGNL